MEKLLTEYQKNAKEKVRFTVNEYKGKEIFNMRVYYETDEGKYLPTRKGLAFGLSALKEFQKSFSEAMHRVQEDSKDSEQASNGANKKG